jgi:hypothetical protein
MVRWAIPIVFGAAIGWFLGDVWNGGGAVLAFVVGFGAWYGYCKVWVRRRYVQRYLAYARKHLDPQACPPPGAEPVELPIVRRIEAIDGLDYKAIRAFYTDDFRFYAPGRKRPQSLDLHMRAMRFADGLLGETESAYTATLADPRERDGFWVLAQMHVRPRRGEPFAIKWVEAWTLTPGQDRIRTRAVLAFTDVAVATRSA